MFLEKARTNMTSSEIKGTDMENIIDFPNRDSIETEACAWISQLDGDRRPSAEDMAALREWINRSPLHGQELRRLAELWGDLNMLTDLAPGLDNIATPRKANWLSRLVTPVFSPLFGPLFGPLLAPRLPLATAFATALVLVASMLVWNNVQHSQPSHQFFTTQIGEQRLEQLPDGSSVQLNTASEVEIDFSSGKRKVRLLQGEAHFTVAHDKSRPFEVFAGNGMVRAVGTAFSVYLKDKDVEVTVTEGRVDIAPRVDNQTAATESKTSISPDILENADILDSSAILDSTNSLDSANNPAAPNQPPRPLTRLSAGQNISFNGDVEPIQTLRADEVARKLSWRDGMLVFSGESLEQVVQEISRYTSQSIIITDPEIRDIRIGGYFKAGDTKAMLEALETSFGVQVSRIDSNLVHLSQTVTDTQ